MARVRVLLLLCAMAAFKAGATSLQYGPSSYTAPGAFPTQWYDSYYNDPTATTAQPQPVISDPVLVRTCTCLFFSVKLSFRVLTRFFLPFAEQGISRWAH